MMVASPKEAIVNLPFSPARRPRFMISAIAGFAVAGLAFAPGAAAAATPIGPNQIFLGQVNGSSTTVKFDVVCPGPANKGHAVNDTVGVEKLQDPIPGFGRTGKASSIEAKLEYTSGTLAVLEPVTKFTTYTTKAVPSSVVTPCSGTGKMIFAPIDGGSGATSSSVPVTFVNIGNTR
jgi:hypothetical protein